MISVSCAEDLCAEDNKNVPDGGEKREILSERPEIRLTERVYGAINEMYVRCKMGNR